MRADQPLPPLRGPSKHPVPTHSGISWWVVAVITICVVLAGALLLKFSVAEATQRQETSQQNQGAKGGTTQVAQRNQTSPQADPSKNGAAANQSTTPPRGAPVRSEQFTQDSWVVSCLETSGPRTQKTCTAVQQVMEAQQKRPVFAWIIGRATDGSVTNVFQTPTGLLLQQGVEFKVGNAKARRAGFVICITQRCEASLPMDDSMVRDAKASLASNAIASVTSADGRVINFSFAVRGFDKILAVVSR